MNENVSGEQSEEEDDEDGSIPEDFPRHIFPSSHRVHLHQ